MSTVKADTIVASDGSSPVTLTKQHAAKGFCHFNQQTPAITTSFNTASLTDSGTGYGKVNWTNAMSNANYSTTTGNQTVNAIGSSDYATCLADDDPYVARTASSWSFKSIYGGNVAAAEFDAATAICSALGDLA